MMAKRLTLLFAMLSILATVLPAMSLSEAERSLRSKNKSEIFRAYDTFKSAYLSASLKGDNTQTRRALNGIVATGNRLHIDVSSYKSKLQALGTVKKKKTSKPATKKVSKGVTPKLLSQNRLNDVRWNEGRLILRFDKRLGKQDVNYFKLGKSGSKGYRYVFDIHAVLDHSRALKHRDLKRITLAQYKPATLRLVLESNRVLKVRFSKRSNTLTVRAGLSRVTSPKTVSSGSKAQRKNKEKIIVIDPGHGGKDGGAVGYKKYREKDIVLAIAAKMAAKLRARGYTVYMTRSKDRFIRLRNRTRYANKKRADLFISIHANAVPKRNAKKAYGIETYFLSPSRSKRATNAAATENRAEVEDMDFYGKNTFLNALNSEKIIASHKLAIDLQSSVLSSLRARYKNIKDGGVREGPFWVLVGAQMPAVLVEVGFITHSTEATRLHSKTYQDYFARGLADGVERYFAKNR